MLSVPRWYFSFSASLRSISARYAAAVMPCGDRLSVPRWYFLFSASLRIISARYSALLIPAGFDVAAWAVPPRISNAPITESSAAIVCFRVVVFMPSSSFFLSTAPCGLCTRDRNRLKEG